MTGTGFSPRCATLFFTMAVPPTSDVQHRTRFQSQKVAHFTESVIRDMTRRAIRYGAVNLAQGFPDFPAPDSLKRPRATPSTATSISTRSPGERSLPGRDRREVPHAGTALEYDPEREITVCCGATEGMIAALLAVTNPGDEIIVFEPFYENYRPDSLLCGAARRLVTLQAPDWTFDPDELRARSRRGLKRLY